MGSINGLSKIAATSIQNSGEFILTNQLDPGTAGQVIISAGPNEPALWGNNSATIPNALTMGTNLSLASGNSSFNGSIADTINAANTDTQLNLTAALPIVINNGGGLNREVALDIDTNTMGVSGGELEVLKVPNTLTAGTGIGFSAGTTYDGSAAITINSTATGTTYQGSSTINIDTSTTPDTINALKVPNVLTASTNIIFTNTDDGASETTYDGSQPITIRAVDTNTEYTAGTNLNNGGTTFNLDTSITGQTGITFLNNGASTNLTGSNYPNKPTTATYLDLSSSTNILPGGVLATKVQRSSYFKSFTSAYGEYSTNFRTSFVAKSTNVMVEFKGIVRADNKVFYGGLYDYNSLAFQADTRNRFNYNDETDQDMTTMTWWMRNLTAGTTYYISPYFRGSSSTVYIYAGHGGGTDGFAPAIMRIYDGGNNVDIY